MILHCLLYQLLNSSNTIQFKIKIPITLPKLSQNFNMTESVADLESLYNVEATFEYTSRNGLVRALRAFRRTFLDPPFLLDHTVLVTRFPPQLFEVEYEDVDNPVIPPKRKALYFPDSQILIFTMRGLPHEVLSRAINELLCDKLKRMNRREDLTARGGTTEDLQNLRKEPDESWGPVAAGYPTCVLEVGLSESLRSLDRDAQRWIGNDSSHVTQVITVKIYPHRHEMIFAIWRRTTGRQAVKDKEIRVELHDGRPRVRNNIRLRLSFEQIFERLPTRGTAEGDVIFSGRELGSIARRVWREMGLIPRG
jgi:hypothetical protein